MRASRSWIPLLVVVSIIVTGTAGASDPEWHLRVKGLWADPDLDLREVDEGIVATANADGAFGLGLGLEYRATERLGVELGLMRAAPDVKLEVTAPAFGVTVTDSDSLQMTPLTLGLNVHLTPDAPVDLYIGPMVAYVMFGDLELSVDDEPERIKVDDDLTWGVNLGADIPFGEGWSLTAGASYLDTTLDASSADEEDDGVDHSFATMTYSVGVAFRF